MKQLTIRLEDAFHQRLRIHCLKTGESVQGLVERLLREELARTRKGKKR